MPLDFVIGKSKFIKDEPELFNAIYDNEYKILFSLVNKHNNQLFTRLSNVYEDQHYSKQEIVEGINILFESIHEIKEQKQKQLIYKLISVFSYANRQNTELWANAD